MLRILLILALLSSCHGTALQIGTGRSFNDFSGGGSFSGGSSSGKHGKSSSDVFDWSLDQDDSTSVWMQMSFQLTPQSVVVVPGPDSVLNPFVHNSIEQTINPLIAEGKTSDDEFVGFDEIIKKLSAIEDRLNQIEVETEGHISWTDIGMGGGATGGGVGLIVYLALLYRKRQNAQGADVNTS